MFFFFQAEDGIRDIGVTGVQTCALPILAERFTAGEAALGGSDRTFAVLYLTLHGVLKLGLVVALLRELRPAYPVAIGVLAVFVGFEAYRAAGTGSWALWVAAALDLVLAVLVVREYRRLRAGPPRPAGSRRRPRRGTS